MVTFDFPLILLFNDWFNERLEVLLIAFDGMDGSLSGVLLKKRKYLYILLIEEINLRRVRIVKLSSRELMHDWDIERRNSIS